MRKLLQENIDLCAAARRNSTGADGALYPAKKQT
jgi:hypothetical protein